MGAPSNVDLGRLVELRLKGLSYRDIGDLVGLDGSTVYQRLAKHEELLEAASNAPAFEGIESKVLAGIRALLLARVAKCAAAQSGSDDELSGYQAMGMYGIAFDKSRTLEGKSNYHIAVLSNLINSAETQSDQALRAITIEAPKRDGVIHTDAEVMSTKVGKVSD